MIKRIYGVAWLERVEPPQEGEREQRRRTQTFASVEERDAFLWRQSRKPEWMYVLSEWEEKIF